LEEFKVGGNKRNVRMKRRRSTSWISTERNKMTKEEVGEGKKEEMYRNRA
jgi:hypothetical protein